MYAAGLTPDITAKLRAYEETFCEPFPLMLFGGTQQELQETLEKAIQSHTPYDVQIPDDVVV